jgi:hypothetical protein
LVQDSSSGSGLPGVAWKTVDYGNKNDIAEALKGIHTVLSFINQWVDHGNKAQKSLIDASITAGVKRFAPSEYGW